MAFYSRAWLAIAASASCAGAWSTVAATAAAIGAMACEDPRSPKSARSMSNIRDQASLERGSAAAAGPVVGAVSRKVPIRALPSRDASVLGFATAGAVLGRSEKPVSRDDCPGGWYSVAPRGYVCANDQTTLDAQHPTLRARNLAPARTAPLPYPYAATHRASTAYEPDPVHQDGVRERSSVRKGSTFAVVGSWNTLDEYDQRQHLAMLTLGVFVPTRDIKPVRLDRAPGFAVDAATQQLPLGIPLAPSTPIYRIAESQVTAHGTLDPSHPIPLTVKSRIVDDRRYLQLTNDTFVAERDVAVVRQRNEFPDFVASTTRWIDVEIEHRIMVLYEGNRPRYVTRVASLPKATLRRGVAWVKSKQITDLVSNSKVLDSEPGHFDTPWIVELDNGVTLRAALDPAETSSPETSQVLGLHPEEASRLFQFVLPEVPIGWHVVNAPGNRKDSSPVVLR